MAGLTGASTSSASHRTPPSAAQLDAQPDAELVKGVVEHIEGGIASVLVGEEREQWDFPLELLPDSVTAESVLVLERRGRRLRFVELDPVAEVVFGRPFDARLRRTQRKVPYMRLTGRDATT